ncbi:hypothetical protein [Cupriavidus metallidurans]|uniref:Lipoprotein transmembrane n=1 Tax=Cupriavidus metallidurans (strain ATCC 43123 / DSM 2839 / NBRC 102507 / CH34) TaxID=266264 RepID=Q1LG60_CUPMC|nr:hypothetical protein [Cupriavidus metallidurans]ABF10866.1 conserved hypothetical protein [Cupriavidus metallidurans CH34]QGS31686.1 hypothetical protein FOB83_22535 [Cupriavidus metallidurans]
MPVSLLRRALTIGVMLATCGMTSNTLATTASRGTIALVMQSNGPNADVDQNIRIRLEGRGFTVRMLNQDTPASNAGDVRLVILSSTISAKQVSAGWRELAVPLLTWENDLLDDLAMTGKRLDTDYGESRRERFVWLVNAPHPVAAGLPAGATNVYRKQAAMNWGKPGLGASIIATLYGQPEKAVIFTYEKGATMDYESLAPARRVMFFLGNDTFTNLSGAGIKLFDAAIDWATGDR